MDKKDITLDYLNETYNYYADIFDRTGGTNLKIILVEKLEVLEKSIAIIKTMKEC